VSGSIQRLVSVAFFLSELDAGGAQRTVVNLVNALPRDRFAAKLVVGNARGAARAWLKDESALVDLDCTRTRKTLRSLRAYLAAARPDVLFSTMIDANIVAALATRFLHRRPALILRETNPHRARGDIGFLRRRAVGYAYPRADAVVALSHGVARELTADYRLDPERVVTIHNPVDVAGWRERADAARKMGAPWGDFGGDGPVLVATGRLIKQKGFDLLLRALARCEGAGRGARLVIVGEGPVRPFLTALASELGLADRVLMAGFIADPAAWYAHGDLFVLPSRWEGFGHVIVEAMACGLPVVAFDCPYGPVDILGDGQGGVLVPPEDVGALARAIDDLLGAPDARNRLASQVRGVADRFAQQRITLQYGQLIESVAQRGHA
jgi:glycosyltransferase involved in cell wall biosynthesis